MRVGVIGAGLSGLAAIKELKEKGFDVVCYEQREDIGGVFSDTGSYDSVLLTVSNYFMAYSDFMPYEEDIKFWTRGEYKHYLNRYVDHFKFRDDILFNHSIDAVTKMTDNRWNLDIVNQKTGKKYSDKVDKLVISSGQFQKPNIPDIPGISSFSGEIIHSSTYKSIEQLNHLKGKHILFLGMGESAADVVTEISAIAGESTLSLRRKHVFSMRAPRGTPIDVLQSRHWHTLPAPLKANIVRDNWKQEINQTSDPILREVGNHIISAPDEPGSVVTKTERIFESISNGLEVNIGGIKKITNKKVTFNDGTEKSFDAIVLCTGFKFSVPFLDPIHKIEDIRDCYLQTFIPEFGDSLALIGFVRPQQGGVPLLSETIARYYALVLSGEKKLPTRMREKALQDKERWRNEFYETPDVFGLVNGLRFVEQVAELIGCRPPEPTPFFQHRKFITYWFHHIWPCQYRLIGPGAREEARSKWLEAPCFNAKDRCPTLKDEIGMSLEFLKLRAKDKLSQKPINKIRPILATEQYTA
ncbi:flavin-containing monooxygenase [Sessilibacter corallicola]|uniref:NAD(P)-binding domain-containing protein n=1 Tax=Sessilibacter corallicola TaxID=2904075 RepID=A0ABQ0A9E5_9GAMM